MKKEIKYCLVGAIVTFILSVTLNNFQVLPWIILLVKIVYIGFTLGLVYFVIRLLADAEVTREGT